MALASYPLYRDPGLAGIGEIPSHWRAERLDHLFTLRKQRPEPEDPRVTGYLDGRVTLRSNVSGQKIKGVVHESGWQRVFPGDFAISGMNAHLGGMGVSDSLGKCSPIYLVLRPNSDTNAHYVSQAVRHLAQIGRLKSLVNTIRFNSADFKRDDLKLIQLWMPPLEEQRQIVAFLDYHDRHVRRFIRAKRRQIELLNEQKQAIINQAVTRGLDPDVRLKPSGVEWLGDVPEHWHLLSIRRCITSSFSGVWGEDATEENSADHVECVRVADFEMSTLRLRTNSRTVRSVPVSARSARLLKQGDVLIEKSGGGDAQPVGRAVLFDERGPSVCSNFITCLRPDASTVRPQFLLYVLFLLQSTRRNVPSIKQTTGIQNLDERHYFSTVVGVPSVDEQDAIIDRLNVQTCRITEVQSQLANEIELVNEYRTRLIADVVTGKLDVRDVDLPAADGIDDAGEWDDESDADTDDLAGEEPVESADE